MYLVSVNLKKYSVIFACESVTIFIVKFCSAMIPRLLEDNFSLRFNKIPFTVDIQNTKFAEKHFSCTSAWEQKEVKEMIKQHTIADKEE